MKLRAVSLFAGCGASDYALYQAAKEIGIEVEVVAAYDSWEPAVRTYNANLPHPIAQVRDLKTMQRNELPEHDLIIGGPPCSPFSVAGKRKGHDDERNCLPDFLRLAGAGEPDESPYIMENVVARLINAPFSIRLCAADFGDVTSRKRWFYSDYLLHVVETPGVRRIRDIRDFAEDERVLRKRGFWTSDEMQAVVEDNDVFPTFTSGDFHGTKNNGSGKPTKGSKIRCKAGKHGHYRDDEALGSLTVHSWHGHDIRTGKLLNLSLRGNSASATAFEDEEVLGSIFANSYHANEASKFVGCRNPSLLEMQRAHSFPEDWDWAGATKTQRGQMIANSWPIGMGTAVCKALLMALAEAPSGSERPFPADS